MKCEAEQNIVGFLVLFTRKIGLNNRLHSVYVRGVGKNISVQSAFFGVDKILVFALIGDLAAFIPFEKVILAVGEIQIIKFDGFSAV